jgi:hypothetical protein
VHILKGLGLGLAAAFLLGVLFGLYQVIGSGLFWESPTTSLMYVLVVGAYGLAMLGVPAALAGAAVGAALHRRRLVGDDARQGGDEGSESLRPAKPKDKP